MIFISILIFISFFVFVVCGLWYLIISRFNCCSECGKMVNPVWVKDGHTSDFREIWVQKPYCFECDIIVHIPFRERIHIAPSKIA